jgi:hypothetical protein
VAPEVLAAERPQHVTNVSPASLGDIVDMRESASGGVRAVQRYAI